MKSDKVITIFFYVLLLITALADYFFREGIKFLRILLICVTILIARLFFKKTFLKRYVSVYNITIIFIFISMYLANVLDFYAINNYDKFLHFTSGILIGFLGFIVYLYLCNGNIQNGMKFITVFVFPFLFSIAIAGLWEIWEFATDNILNLTAQWTLEDTMWDIILGSFGGLITSSFIYFSLKNKSNKVVQRIIDKSKI